MDTWLENSSTERTTKRWANARNFLILILLKSAECTNAIDGHNLDLAWVALLLGSFRPHNPGIIWLHDQNHQLILLASQDSAQGLIQEPLPRLQAEKILANGIHSRIFSILTLHRASGSVSSAHGYLNNRNRVNRPTMIIHIHIHLVRILAKIIIMGKWKLRSLFQYLHLKCCLQFDRMATIGGYVPPRSLTVPKILVIRKWI